MRPGFRPPQRVTNGHRAEWPQTYAIFTINITPIAGLLSVRNAVHNNNDDIVCLLTEEDKRLSSQ